MVCIIKGTNKKNVTKGAYEEYYKHLGYTFINKKQQLKKEVEKKHKDDLIDESNKIKDAEKKESYSRK